MKADGECRAAADNQERTFDLGSRQVARELEHKPVDPFVGDEEVGAKTDDRNGNAALGSPGEGFRQLSIAPGPREPARRPARAECREPREGDVLFDHGCP